MLTAAAQSRSPREQLNSETRGKESGGAHIMGVGAGGGVQYVVSCQSALPVSPPPETSQSRHWLLKAPAT